LKGKFNMSGTLIINTETGHTNNCRDPYDHLGPVEWVDKQIEYGSQELVISGRGLIPFLRQMGNNLVGCEIGVCHGFTTEYMVKSLSNICKIYAVDHYPSFVDWDGTRVTAERQEETKQRCERRLAPYRDKISLHYEDSATFSTTIEDDSLDFVFIDGDHSYEAVLRDCRLYWPKVKNGGLFAGHDINLQSVRQALGQFFSESRIDDRKLKIVENNAWFIMK
jgi:predicted O-methyltransferase YrrM